MEKIHAFILAESLERKAMRKADKAFAPSRFVAEHYRNRHGISVEVLRPPFAIEVAPAAEPPCGLPERFFVHFGQLRRRKGTHWLGEALKQSFEMESSLRMVWVGKHHSAKLESVLAGLGTHRPKVQVLQPLPKPNSTRCCDVPMLPYCPRLWITCPTR